MKTSWRNDTLIFRYMQEDDLENIAKMLSKPEVCVGLFFGPNSEKETRDYFGPIIKEVWEEVDKGKMPSAGEFSVFLSRNDEYIGNCAVIPIDYAPGNYMIGYQFDTPYWKKGYAKTALRFLVGFGFGFFKARRLSGECMSNNPASGAVMKKLGFQQEGCRKNYWLKNGEEIDELCFGLLKEWIDPDEIEKIRAEFGI